MSLRHATLTLTHRALEGRVIRLGYRLHGGPSPDVELEETFTLPDRLPGDTASLAVDRALEALHVAAGVSYWKTSCPPRVERDEGPLADADARFFGRLWGMGLGEFFVRNGLPPRERVDLPSGPVDRAPVAGPSGLADLPPLVLIGGGKDSAVSIEILRAADERPTLLCVGRHARILHAAESSGLPLLVVERSLPRALLDLNAQGALNGHVPVTALIQLVGQIVALLGGFSAVVASNERSASFGNMTIDGIEVNHQWSKGLEFERSLQAWSARHLVVGPPLFSLLRPLSELRIARELARMPRWFPVVTSCNANFALAAKPGVPRWCGTCPKCVFVFTVTTPWLDDAGRAELFGCDMLADERNVPLLEELLGLSRHKPFECVGTPDEARAALWACHEHGLHADTPAMRLFRERVLPVIDDPPALLASCLEPIQEHLIPVRFKAALDASLQPS